MGVIGILFLLIIFTSIGFFIRWWFCERRKENDRTQQHSSEHPTQPTTASTQQEIPQSKNVSDIPEAKVIWVSPSAPPLPENYYAKSNA